MTSFTSSFKKIFIVATMVLILAAEVLAIIVYAPGEHPKLDYQWRDQIDMMKPDIVLIGSSPLGRGVEPVALEKSLNASLERSFKTLLIVRTHSAGCFWQLLLRNQVCGSRYKRYAVGLMIKPDDLTSFNHIWDGGTGRPKQEILAQLKDNDTRFLHYRKELQGTKVPGKRRVNIIEKWMMQSRLISYRKEISQDLRNIFVSGLMKKINPSFNARRVLNRRFAVNKLRNDFDLGELGIAGPGNESVDYDFDKVLDTSFLPDIIALKQDCNIDLFVVVMPLSPRNRISRFIKREKQYSEKLKVYLEGKGVKYISFRDDPEFNDPDLFLDANHLKDPTRLSQRLAEKLVAEGIIQ